MSTAIASADAVVDADVDVDVVVDVVVDDHRELGSSTPSLLPLLLIRRWKHP